MNQVKKNDMVKLLIAIAIGAALMHLYRTKTPKGKGTGK